MKGREVPGKPFLKAIETHYNGCRFRSRLEARWAVFVDALGIRYEYEYQGFTTIAGGYLPDFFLPEIGIWIEIKGHSNVSYQEFIKLASFGMDTPILMFHGSVELPRLRDGNLVAGSTAYSLGKLEKLDPKMRERFKPVNGLPWMVMETNGAPAVFVTNDWKHGVSIDSRPWLWHERNDGSFHVWPYPSFDWSPTPTGFGFFFPDGRSLDIVPPLTTRSLDSPRLQEAYTAARSARFEFGENGRPRR